VKLTAKKREFEDAKLEGKAKPNGEPERRSSAAAVTTKAAGTKKCGDRPTGALLAETAPRVISIKEQSVV
jgi:hypothetical protein